MKRSVTIGKQGDQPFKILAGGVSSCHAMITIQDNGIWVLKDLDSTNGTFIQDENNVFVRVAERIIQKDTVIRLGSDSTIHSYQFVAYQVFKENADDFSYEFNVLRKQWEHFGEQRDKLESKMMRYTFLPVLISLFFIVLSCLIPKDWSVSVQMNVMRLVMIVPSLASPLINSYSKKEQKKLNDKLKSFVCPNPECGYLLSEMEIKKGMCNRCKKHI